jgi:WS/DGAT C-terminal domain
MVRHARGHQPIPRWSRDSPFGLPDRRAECGRHVSLRAAQDTGWGNKITLMRLTVPTGEPDPVARMRLLHRLTGAAREEPSLAVTGAIAGVLNMLPVGYVSGILKHADFVASNVPGVPRPVYVAGGKVTGTFAFGPTIGTSAGSRPGGQLLAASVAMIQKLYAAVAAPSRTTPRVMSA